MGRTGPNRTGPGRRGREGPEPGRLAAGTRSPAPRGRTDDVTAPDGQFAPVPGRVAARSVRTVVRGRRAAVGSAA
jgi:hypothetical protein